MTAAAALRDLSVSALTAAVAARELDPVEVVECHLAAIDGAADLNAVISICPESALDRARAGVDGPLAGAPLLVKDIFDTAGVRTTYGSSIFRTNVPDRSAAAVVRAELAGAIVIGKANLHEFAWGTTSQNPHYGAVGNPATPGRIAGGSSGGNAAALAARLSSLGLGTDTADRLAGRLPAAASSASSRFSANPHRRLLPALSHVRHGRADGAVGCGLHAALLGAVRAATP